MSDNYGDARLTYGEYLKIPELLTLQQCLSDPPAHDELQFIVVHQAYELWFKLLLFEVDSIVKAIDLGDIRSAVWLFRRVIAIARLLNDQIHILETMTPTAFLEFRDHLKPASGFQSVQFRELEFVCNLKNPAILQHLNSDPASLARLEKRLDEPTVWDAFVGLLRSRGFDAPDSEAIQATVARIHQEQQHEAPHQDLFLLTEAMIEFDEFFGLWRLHHVRMVERMIGNKPGTGGSQGVRYLATTLDRKCFPDLWSARTLLGNH